MTLLNLSMMIFHLTKKDKHKKTDGYMIRQFELLSSRRFAPIFITQFLGALNDNIFRFALILAITFNNSNIASSSERSDVSLIAGIFILPFLLFSGLSGQLADKFEKSKTIRLKNQRSTDFDPCHLWVPYGKFHNFVGHSFLMGSNRQYSVH